MRFNTVIISFLIILFCVNNSFSDVRTLAIKPLDTLENVDRMAAKTASDLLFTKIGKHTENKQMFKLIETVRIEKILEEQKKQFEDCFSNECGIKLGKLLAAQVIIMGSIGKFGDNMFIFNIKLINVETGQSEKTASANCKINDYKEFENAIEQLSKEILDVRDAVQTGIIELTSNPAEAEIFINGVKTDKKTPTSIAVSPGIHSVMLIKDGFSAVEFSLQINANDKKTKHIIFQSEFGLITVTSEPTGASGKIYAGNKILKSFVTPFNDSLPVGAYSIIFKNDKYEDYITNISISENLPINFNYNLVKKTERLYLIVSPDNSEITINGQKYNDKNFELGWGDYEIVISKTGYKSIVENIKLELGKPLTKTYSLKKIKVTGKLRITSEPEFADIYIDGELKKEKTPATLENIPAGPVKVRIVKDLYYHFDTTVVIPANAYNKEDLNNIKLNQNYGSVEIVTEPSGALIYLDNENYERGKTPFTLDKIKSGKHKVTVKLQEYYDYTSEFEIKDAETAKIKLPLKPRFSYVSINSIPEGAELFINGVNSGKTPYINEHMKSGNYEIAFKLKLYEPLYFKLNIDDDKRYVIRENLNPRFGLLTVATEPSEVEVTISDSNDKDYKYITPRNDLKLEIGKYKLKFVKSKYKNLEKEIEITLDRPVVLNENLIPITGNLDVSSIPEDDADIYINDKYTGKKTPDIIKDLMIGEYIVAVKKRKDIVSETVKIFENQNTEIKLDFAKAERGALDLVTSPKGADVYINRVLHNTKSNCKIKDIPVGKIEITVIKYGIEKTAVVNIEKDKTSKLEIELPNGNLKIKTEPKNSEVYVNDKFYGSNTPVEIKNLPAGDYYVKVNMTSHPFYSQKLKTTVYHNKTTSEKIVLKKKPFYKKWWFWAIVIGGGAAAAGGGGGGGNGGGASSSSGGGGGTSTGSVTVDW